MSDPITEVTYLGHDNTIDLLLKADDVAQDLAGCTSMTITLDGKTITSDNTVGDPITWAQAGYATGEVRLDLGGQAITAGTHTAWLVVYDASNPDGIVWGSLRITVVAEVEAEGLGGGTIPWKYTVTDADTGTPINGVLVWVTTDAAGTNLIASGTTNSSGEVTFNLDTAATIYVWRSCAGYNFTNPDIEAVTP
jgi:hypothetical protein